MDKVYLSPIQNTQPVRQTRTVLTRRGKVVVVLGMLLVALAFNWAMSGKSLVCDWRQGITPCAIVTDEELFQFIDDQTNVPYWVHPDGTITRNPDYKEGK